MEPGSHAASAAQLTACASELPPACGGQGVPLLGVWGDGVHSCVQVHWHLAVVQTALFLLFIELIDPCPGFRAAQSLCLAGRGPRAPGYTVAAGALPPTSTAVCAVPWKQGLAGSGQLRDALPGSAATPPSFCGFSSPKNVSGVSLCLPPMSWRGCGPPKRQGGWTVHQVPHCSGCGQRWWLRRGGRQA